MLLIGYDVFTEPKFCDDYVSHIRYDEMEVTGSNLDHIFIDEDVDDIPLDLTPPENWRYNTSLNAFFQGTLEGGSVEAGGMQVEKVIFQKRAQGELEWQDVDEMEYESDDRILYEAMDRVVANGYKYTYCLLPAAPGVEGIRIESEEIKAEFHGVFLSDKDHNYGLFYDLELSDIENHTQSALFEPLNSKFPIVVHSNLDYATLDVAATFISRTTEERPDMINIRLEREGKNNLLEFIKNGKPKIYRDHNGILKMVSVIGNPIESPSSIPGIAKLSFSLVEIGEVDGRSLRRNNLLGFNEVY